MCLAARPGQIVESRYWDLIVPNRTSSDLRRGAFGQMMDTIASSCEGLDPCGTSRGKRRTGSPVRIGGIYHPDRLLPPDTFNPHCFHVPWVVWSTLTRGHPLNLRCRPMYYICSRSHHHLLPMSVCEMRIEYICKVPVHIFPEVFLSLEANMP